MNETIKELLIYLLSAGLFPLSFLIYVIVEKIKEKYSEYVRLKKYKFKYQNDPVFKLQEDYKEYTGYSARLRTKSNIWLDSDNIKELIIIENYTSPSKKILFEGTIDDPLMRTVIEVKRTLGEELKRCRECGSWEWAFININDEDSKFWRMDKITKKYINGFCSGKCEERCKERDFDHYQRTISRPKSFFNYKEKEEYIKKYVYTDAFDCVPMYELAKKQNFLCSICSGKMSHDWIKGGDNYLYHSIDHIIPVTKGGLHKIENIQIVHLLCNMVKWTDSNIKLSITADQFLKHEIITAKNVQFVNLLLHEEDYIKELTCRYKKYIIKEH